jgi:negative regulator of replication initiation
MNNSYSNWQDDPLLLLTESTQYKTGNGKERYFAILKFLYEKDTALFGREIELFTRGTRVHISRDSKIIEKSGNSTKPERLNGTPYYVLTDLDNPRKRTILRVVLRIFHYPGATIGAVLQSIPDSPFSRGGHKRSIIHEYQAYC